jgi:hypothetical protein
LCEALNVAGPDIRVQTLLGIGSPGREILRVVRDQGVDLIVMGLHGVYQPWHAFFASITAQVVRGAGCGVITVRPSSIATTRSKAGETSNAMESAELPEQPIPCAFVSRA